MVADQLKTMGPSLAAVAAMNDLAGAAITSASPRHPDHARRRTAPGLPPMGPGRHDPPRPTTWTRLGFENPPGDHLVNGVWVTSDFKGPGKDRAVYRLRPS